MGAGREWNGRLIACDKQMLTYETRFGIVLLAENDDVIVTPLIVLRRAHALVACSLRRIAVSESSSMC